MALRLAFDLHHLDERRYEFAARELDYIGRQIGAWRKPHQAHAQAAKTAGAERISPQIIVFGAGGLSVADDSYGPAR